MGPLSKLFGSKDDREEDAIVQMFKPVYDGLTHRDQVGGEDYCYCDECKGLLPCSSGPHPHKK